MNGAGWYRHHYSNEEEFNWARSETWIGTPEEILNYILLFCLTNIDFYEKIIKRSIPYNKISHR